jgi:aspartate racemase
VDAIVDTYQATYPRGDDLTKRIGILGGISAESTAEYYLRITRGYFERNQDQHYPEIVIFSLDLQHFTDLENSGDRVAYVAEIMRGIQALQDAGAEFVLMAANSPHAAFDEVAAAARVPLLSIVQVTAQEASRLGLRTLLLLGIKFTMQSPFYPRACQELGIQVLTPSKAEQDTIEHIIFGELAQGTIRDSSRTRLVEIIDCYPVDGVILGCTELPLILRQEYCSAVLLDTMELDTQAALDFALAE